MKFLQTLKSVYLNWVKVKLNLVWLMTALFFIVFSLMWHGLQVLGLLLVSAFFSAVICEAISRIRKDASGDEVIDIESETVHKQ
jgi:asparagine N-glycosylation enzyme membrane subunit Stt3